MNNKKKIAILELGKYHEECLYSQLKFLTNANYLVTLISNPKNAENIESYNLPIDKLLYFDPRDNTSIFKRVLKGFSLYQFIKKESFEKIVFNTASSNKETICFAFFLPKKVKRFGTIHNLKKLNKSFSQKIISKKLKNYYVLNDFLKTSCKIEDTTIRLSSYYPIFFPKYDSTETINKNGDYWICIPGELNYNRRDYDIVIKSLKLLKNIENLKIILLGKMNPKKQETIKFLGQIKELRLEKYFVFFNGFIENDIFHTYIKKSDFVLAPVSVNEKNYLNYKITGAYNLAFAYQKPLICPAELKIIPDLLENSYFYTNSDDLAKLLTSINSGGLVQKQLYASSKWGFQTQQKKYLQFLESES